MGTPCARNSGIVKPLSSEQVSYETINSNYDTIDASLAKGKWDATVDPAVADDSGDGYSVGSIWANITGHKIFIAEAVTVGAAVWRQVWPALVADMTGLIKSDGSVALSANWDAGAHEIRAETLESDVATGTAPLTVASTTKVTNLNCDLLDGLHDTSFIRHSLATAANDLLMASGSGAYIKKTLAEAQALVCLPGGLYWQALINGSFQINQQSVATYTSATAPANSDDTYLHDQWILLSDGNDIVDVSAESSVIPTGGSASVKFEVEMANKKFGYLQIIENKDAIKYAGKVASLQFKARTVTGKVIENLRAVVLSWSSTADAVTSDVVASWGAEGSNPTWATNWTAENTATNKALVADTWTTFTIENIAIDTASMANLAVFIWVDDTDAAVDDLLYISDVQLNQGAVCLPYQPVKFVNDLLACKRFYETSYIYGTPAGNVNTAVGMCALFAAGVGSCYVVSRGFQVPKIGTTTVTIYSYAGTINKVTDTGSTDIGTTCVSANTERDGLRAVTDAANPFTAGAFYRCHWVADARL